MLLQIEKIKKFNHIGGKNEKSLFDLESSVERYLAHREIDGLICKYEGCHGLENSIGELYELHDIISNKNECDVIIELGEWNLFVETFK